MWIHLLLSCLGGHIGTPDTPFQNYLLTKHPVIFKIIIRVCSQVFSHTPSFLFKSNSLFYNLQRKQNASKVFSFPLTLAKPCLGFSPKLRWHHFYTANTKKRTPPQVVATTQCTVGWCSLPHLQHPARWVLRPASNYVKWNEVPYVGGVVCGGCWEGGENLCWKQGNRETWLRYFQRSETSLPKCWVFFFFPFFSFFDC